MRTMLTMAAVAVTSLCGVADACIDPLQDYYAGIVLNDGEEVNPGLIEELAESEDSYIKECFWQKEPDEEEVASEGDSVERCSYKLRSVYASDVMVFVGYVEGSFKLYGDVMRVFVFFDTTEVPSQDDKVAALRIELARLDYLGIITIDETKIAHVMAKLLASGGPGQYWTKQDSVLSFNMWFDGTSVNGVYGVNGVRGGACGAGITYDLPENEFVTTETVAGPSVAQSAGSGALRAVVHGQEICVSFSPVEQPGTKLVISGMDGRKVAQAMIAKGASSLTLGRSDGLQGRLCAGCYIVSIVRGGRMIQSSIMTIANR